MIICCLPSPSMAKYAFRSRYLQLYYKIYTKVVLLLLDDILRVPWVFGCLFFHEEGWGGMFSSSSNILRSWSCSYSCFLYNSSSLSSLISSLYELSLEFPCEYALVRILYTGRLFEPNSYEFFLDAFDLLLVLFI